MEMMRKLGVIATIIVLALATISPGHQGGGGGGGYVETSDPFGETTETSDPFGETTETSDPFGETTETSAPFGETTETSDPFGETTETSSPEAAAAAQNYLDGVDLNASDLDQNAMAQALNDLDTYQGLAQDVSTYALQNNLVDDGASVVDLLANLPADAITPDAVQNVYRLPSAAEYQQLPEQHAQKTLAIIMGTSEITAVIEANFTIQLVDANFLGLVNAIADSGALVDEAAANSLASILDPATLADAPLTEQGLQNLVASVSTDLSDAFLDAAQIITADFGIAEFTDFAVDATVFDTQDYDDIPAIEVNPLVLQLYS